MSSTDDPRDAPGATPDPTPDQIAAARLRLGDLDARVFPQAAVPTPAEHADLIRAATRRLFGHGL